MSGIDSLRERLRRSRTAIVDVEVVASRFPNDRWVTANLDALKRDVSNLEAQWEREIQTQKSARHEFQMDLLPTHVLHVFRFYAFLAICGGVLVIVGAAILKMPWVLVVAGAGFCVGRYEKDVVGGVRRFWEHHCHYGGLATKP